MIDIDRFKDSLLEVCTKLIGEGKPVDYIALINVICEHWNNDREYLCKPISDSMKCLPKAFYCGLLDVWYSKESKVLPCMLGYKLGKINIKE